MLLFSFIREVMGSLQNRLGHLDDVTWVCQPLQIEHKHKAKDFKAT